MIKKNFLIILIIIGCVKSKEQISVDAKTKKVITKDSINEKQKYISATFDFPVGKPNAKG